MGAATGAAIGSDLDRQAAELRDSLSSNISVTNMGDYLVVNMPQDLLFATGSAALNPSLQADIRAVGAQLLKYPNSTIEVVGHTDNVGSAAANQDLSQRTERSAASLEETAASMRTMLRETGHFIDPHTAVGVTVSEKETRDPSIPMVVLGTAHPAKFPDAVIAVWIPQVQLLDAQQLPQRLRNAVCYRE